MPSKRILVLALLFGLGLGGAADDARRWLVLNNQGKEQWPAFVHDGQLVAIGMKPESFDAVGEPEVGDRLDECVSGYTARAGGHGEQ